MHVLGIDGGGSQTRALLCNQSGDILGRGRSGPTNPKSTSHTELQIQLQAAIAQALSGTQGTPPAAIHLGIAGASDVESQNILAQLTRHCIGAENSKITVGHDLEIALEGGLLGAHGLVLVAGTGSACYGKSPNGNEIQCGGWGELVDDAGSGSWIGLRALQVCVRQADGRLLPSPLKQAVMDYLEIESMDAFKTRIHGRGLSRKERAQLAPIVLNLAQSGDPAAHHIMIEAIDELCALAASARQQLASSACKLLLTGGLTQHVPFKNLLKNTLHSKIADVTLAQPTLSPIAGAVLIALKNTGISPQQINVSSLANACD